MKTIAPVCRPKVQTGLMVDVAAPADPAGAWAPLAPAAVSGLFRGADFSWWIAGGWAIDLFLGAQTRAHHDTDVEVLRGDQIAVQAYLQERGWELYAAEPPGTLRRWTAGEVLPASVHDIWTRPGPAARWALQLMLMDTVDTVISGGPDANGSGRWIYRRDPRVGGPLVHLGRRTAAGLPYLAPEVQLLYKAKRPALPKNAHDLAVALPRLDAEARAWLAAALTLAHPEHPWLRQLST